MPLSSAAFDSGGALIRMGKNREVHLPNKPLHLTASGHARARPSRSVVS